MTFDINTGHSANTDLFTARLLLLSPFPCSPLFRGVTLHPLRRRRGQGPHLAKRWEPRGFSRVAAAFSSYDGDLSLPLGSLQSKGLSRVFSNTTVPCLLCVVLDPKQDINKCALPIWLISWSGDGWMWPMLPWESPGVPDSSGSALLLGHDSVLPTEADGPEPTLLGQITTRNTESPGVRTLLPTLGSPEPANWGLG